MEIGVGIDIGEAFVGKTLSHHREMVTCERCGWSFDSIRMSQEGSCPRCRVRDGVKSPLTDRSAEEIKPSFLDLIAEASEKIRREKDRLPGA